MVLVIRKLSPSLKRRNGPQCFETRGHSLLSKSCSRRISVRYLSIKQEVASWLTEEEYVCQTPSGSSLICTVKYRIGEDPSLPGRQWSCKLRDVTSNWGTLSSLGGSGRSEIRHQDLVTFVGNSSWRASRHSNGISP